MSTAEKFKNETLELFSGIRQDLEYEWQGEEPGINFFLLLGVLFVCIIYIIIAAFYFSRIIGSILALLISRFLQWKTGSSSVKVGIGSFSISILAGKIMFRNLSFTDDDMNIQINDGWIIFSYWRLVPEKCSPPKAMNSSRLHISLNGFKIHFYNRISLYKKALKTTGSNMAAQALSEMLGDDPSSSLAAKQRTLRHQPPPDKLDEWWDNFWRLSGFIKVDISSGRIICGNHLMPTVFATVFENLQSKVFLTKASNEQDRYMLRASTSMDNLRVSLVKSTGYVGDNFEDPPRTMGEGFAILQSSLVHCFYHQDLLGLVQSEVQSQFEDVPVWESIWRFDSNTVFSYGPWADKQREELYSFFYPLEFTTAAVTEMPKRGQRRIHLQHDIRISCLKEAQIDIWFMRAEELNYLHTEMKQGSSFEFTIPYIINENGFTTNFKGSLLWMESTTSLPLRNFIECETMRFNVLCHYPRTYNAHQKWHLSLELHKISTWIVWDHKRFLTDLMNEWTSSSKSDLCKFVPYTWTFSISVIDKFEVLLVLNDKNWVETLTTPTSENMVAAIVGNQLSISFALPFIDFAPNTIPIDFEVEVKGQLALRTNIPSQFTTEPLFSTLQKSANYQQFMKKSTVAFGFSLNWFEIWRTESLKVKCNYIFHPLTSPIESDINPILLESWLPPKIQHPTQLEPDNMKMEISIADSEVLFSGIIIKLILDLKDNYFGSYDQISDVASKPLHSARMKTREQLPPENYRSMDVQLSLKVSNIRAHCLNYSQQIDENESERCPILLTEELIVELKKVHPECLIQVLLGPTVGCFYPSNSLANVKDGWITLSALQFRGHGLYSDVGVPWEVEILEYAWLMEIILGKITAKLHPVQMLTLIQFVDTLLVLTTNDDEKLEIPDRLDLCQHFENIRHCGRPMITPGNEPRNYQKSCESSETLKYKLIRVSVDEIDVLIVEEKASIKFDVDHFKLSFCNSHIGSFNENLVISLPSVKLKQLLKIQDKNIWVEAGSIIIQQITLDIRLPISESKIHLLEERRLFLQKHDRPLPRLYFLWEKNLKRCGCFGALRFFSERDKCGLQFLLNPLVEHGMPHLNPPNEQPGFLQSILLPETFGVKLRSAEEDANEKSKEVVFRRESSSSFVSAKSEQSPGPSLMDYAVFLENFIIEYPISNIPTMNLYSLNSWISKNAFKIWKKTDGISELQLVKKESLASLAISPVSPPGSGKILQSNIKYPNEIIETSEAEWGKESTSLYIRGQFGDRFHVFASPLAIEATECLANSISDQLKSMHPAYLIQGIYNRCSTKHHKQPLTSSISKQKENFVKTNGIHLKLAFPDCHFAVFQCHSETPKIECEPSMLLIVLEQSQLNAKTTNKSGEERKMIYQCQIKQTHFQMLHAIDKNRFDTVYNKMPISYGTNWEILLANSKSDTKLKPILDLDVPIVDIKLVVCNLLKKNSNATQLDKLEIEIPMINLISVLGKPLDGEDPSKEPSFYEVFSPSINAWIYNCSKLSKTITKIVKETEEWKELSMVRILAEALDWHDIQTQIPEKGSALGDVKLYYKHFSSCPSCKLMLLLLKYISRNDEENEERKYYMKTMAGKDKFIDEKTRKTSMIALLSHWQTIICNQINLADHSIAEKYRCVVEKTNVEFEKLEESKEFSTILNAEQKLDELNQIPQLNGVNDNNLDTLSQSRRTSDNLTVRARKSGHKRGPSTATKASVNEDENQPMDLYHWILKAHKEYKERREPSILTEKGNIQDVNAMELMLSVFFWSFYEDLELEESRLDSFPKIHFGLIFTINLGIFKVDVIEKKLLMSPRNEMLVALTCHHLMTMEAFEIPGRLYYEITYNELELKPIQAAIDLKYEAKITNIELVIALASVSFINDLTVAILTCQAAVKDIEQVLKKDVSTKSLVSLSRVASEVDESGRPVSSPAMVSIPKEEENDEIIDDEEEEIHWTESVLDKLYDYQRSKFHAASKRQDLLQIHCGGNWQIKTVMLESVLTDLIVSMNLMKIDGKHEHFRDDLSGGEVLIPAKSPGPGLKNRRHSFVAITTGTAIKNAKPILDHCTLSMKKASLILSEHVGSNRGAVETKRILSCSLRESNILFERTKEKPEIVEILPSKVKNILRGTLGEIEVNLPMHAQSIHEVVLRHGPQLNEQLHRIVSQPQPYIPVHSTETIGVTGERSTAIAAEPSTSNLLMTTMPLIKLPDKPKHHRQTSVAFANLSNIPTTSQIEIEFKLELIGLELNAMLLPSLRAKYRLDKASATGNSGETAKFAAEMPEHQLLFEVVKPADEGTSVAPAPVDTFILPLPKIKASGNYQSAKLAAAKSPELLHRYRNPLLQFREGGYFDIELVIGKMEYMFSTDLLNQILFAEQSFRSELSFLLEKLMVERPSTMNQPSVFSNPNPFLFNFTFRGEGEPWVQLTASTPSRTAIRFTIDGPNASITNRLTLKSANSEENISILLNEQLFFGTASVQVNVKLGQLFKTSMYEEAPEELQEVATFMTNINVQNEESSHIAPHNYVISLNRPILLLKSTALDKAILLWLNYRNVHNYWREERQRLMALNRPKMPKNIEKVEKKIPQTSSSSNMTSTDINLNLSLSIQNGLYVCVPLYSSELSDNLAAVVISLEKSDVTVCIKKELACNANFDGFRVSFIDNFDEHSLREPWIQENSNSDAIHSNFFYFPHGSYKLCSSAYSAKNSTESAKWYLSVKSQMKGMIIDFDPRIGKLMSLFAHTLSSIGSNDETAEDYEPSEISAVVPENSQKNDEEEALDDETNKEFQNVVGHENKVRWLERKLHEQSMLVADLSSYGVCAPSVEVERRKLRVLELMRFKEFRQTMLEKLKRKTTTVVAGKSKVETTKAASESTSTVFLQPNAMPINEKRGLVESTGNSEAENDKDHSKLATTGSAVDESVDMNIDVQINIESGQCILRANPTMTVTNLVGQTLAKRPSARDLKKNFVGKELCITNLSIPSVDVKVFYTSNDAVASTPDNIKLIFKEQLKLRKTKNNCFYLALELSSTPEETLVTPNLADFLEQVIEPLPESLFETTKDVSENSSESATVPIVVLDTSSLPLDVLFHMVVQSSTIRFEGEQQKSSAADCLLKLPRLALMASTRKFNEQATSVGGIYLSATLSAFSLNIYSPHQQATSHDALSLTLDKLSVTASRTKLPKEDEKNKVQIVIVSNVGAANFNYDMRRLSELLAFPKPWYRKMLVKRLFFGDQAIQMRKNSMESLTKMNIQIGKEENKKISVIKPKKLKEEHDWAASCVFTMQWQELNVHAQMSNTMGNTTWLARRGLLRGHLHISPKRKRDMAVTFKLLRSELSAQGGAISGEISISKLLISARHSRIEKNPPENKAKLEFKQIENRVEWMSRPIFIGKFVDPKIVLTDEWRYNRDLNGKVTESTCFVNISGSWTDLQMIITKMTVDDFTKIIKKLESFFGEQLKNSRLMWEAELEQQRKEALDRRLSMDLDSHPSLKRISSGSSLTSTISDFTLLSKSPEVDHFLDPHWQRVLELITNIQLKKTFFPLPEIIQGVTLTGGTIEFEAKSISLTCMNGEMSAPNWALFHMRQASVDIRNTAKYAYLDKEKTQVGIHMEQKLIFRLGSAGPSDSHDCKAVVCRVQHGRNFMIRNNATIEMWLESMIADALKQLPLFADPGKPPIHAHNVLELFEFPALEAILTTLQNQSHDGVQDEPEIVESSFVCEFHSSVCVQTDFNAQVGFLPELLKSYTKNSADGPLLAEERPKPKEPQNNPQIEEKRDPRKYECFRWIVDPKIRFIDRFKWNPPVIDDVLRKLQIFDHRLTIPKVIQRGVLDRSDALLAALLENIVIKLALKEY